MEAPAVGFRDTNTLYFKHTSFIYIIKYPYLVNLSTIINRVLYSYLVIKYLNFSSLIIKCHNITFYNLLTNLISCNTLYSLYLFSLS